MPPAPRSALPAATTARIIWIAMVSGVVLFLAVGTYVRSVNPPAADPALGVLAWIALAVAAAGLLTSRVLARRPAPAEPQARLRLLITQLAACELGALLGGVGWLLLGAPVALAAAGVGLLGMVLAFPRSAPPAPAGGRPARPMIR